MKRLLLCGLVVLSFFGFMVFARGGRGGGHHGGGHRGGHGHNHGGYRHRGYGHGGYWGGHDYGGYGYRPGLSIGLPGPVVVDDGYYYRRGPRIGIGF